MMWKILKRKELALGQGSNETSAQRDGLERLVASFARKGVGWLIFGWISFKILRKAESVHLMLVISGKKLGICRPRVVQFPNSCFILGRKKGF
jgi:hypothetical protein